MSTSFTQGEILGRGDLDIFLADSLGNPTNAYEITYALYYVDPAVAPLADALLTELIGDDPRFFFAPAGPDRGYNYSGNAPLEAAIAAGYRGAYWDILRRSAEAGPAHTGS